MKKATLTLAALVPALLFLSPLNAQRDISKRRLKQLQEDRKIALKDLKQAIKDKSPEDAVHVMRVMMRLTHDKKSTQEIAKGIIKVLKARFSGPIAHVHALKCLKELGETGIIELEKAVRVTIRHSQPQVRIRAVTTLIEAKRKSSWPILIDLGNDSDSHLAIAAVKGLLVYINLPPKEMKALVSKLARLMRRPTKAERENDSDLPPVQKAIREVLTEITGGKCVTVLQWKKFIRSWKGLVAKKSGAKGNQAEANHARQTPVNLPDQKHRKK